MNTTQKRYSFSMFDNDILNGYNNDYTVIDIETTGIGEKHRIVELAGVKFSNNKIVDIFDKVVNMPTEDEKLKNFLLGFKMLNDRFNQVLENNDVKKIDALNKKFDSNYHECISVEVNDEVESETVTKVMTNGYMYKDRVLKPSTVIVSKKSEEN